VNKRRWNFLLVIVAILGSAWIHVTRVPTEAEVVARIAARVNFQAPDFGLTTIDGKEIALSDYRGKVVLINFWATWCPPCRTEMPDIRDAAVAHPDNFVVLAINNGESDEAAENFARLFNLQFPVLLDSDGAVARKYNVQGMPTSFFVDRAGIVRAANMGAMSRAYIEAQIEALSK
jgi:peroxiredoxin